MITRKKLIGLGSFGAALAASGLAISSAYRRDLKLALDRIDPCQSSTVQTRFGQLEYADRGTGPPFMMIHGTGGGFDQGLFFASRMITAGYRVLAPSRFGYLRSHMPGEPSSENQADALADFLDILEIDRIVVAGGSAGALSALQFAIRHPDRCTALIPIVPATFAPNRPPARPWTFVETAIAQLTLKSDLLFWLAITSAPDTFTDLILATDKGVVERASPDEQKRVSEILKRILPVSKRAKGLVNDAKLAGNPVPMELSRITAPTLVISLEDDGYLTADAARHIASSVKKAKIIVWSTGGHLWVGHDQDLFMEIDRFLSETGHFGDRRPD